MVTIHTNHGNITIELFADKAPETVANFMKYVESGHYTNTLFHRVIDGFMIQGGGFEPGMKQKPVTTQVKNEANNGVSNQIGTIAMARTMDPHSASCQFFININDNTFLDFKNETPQGWGYCVFGKVTAGMEVVNQIKSVATGNIGGHGDVPKADVIIESIEVNA